MERVFKALKDFILADMNGELALFEDDAASLPPLSERAVVFGAIDPLKMTGDTLCSIYPETIEDDPDMIDGLDRFNAKVSVTFLCRGAKYEELMARACRYARAFKRAAQKDWSLGGRVEDARVEMFEFFPDCGIAEKQATACEISLIVTLEEEEK